MYTMGGMSSHEARDGHSKLHERIEELEAQRDALIAAVKGIIAWDKRRGFLIPYAVRDPAHAAIARAVSGAKGGAV